MDALNCLVKEYYALNINAKKKKSFFTSINECYFFFMVIIFYLLPYNVDATVYYVSISGNDSNSGLSENQSWRTLDKVNNFVARAGDQILFRCGDTWSGTLKFHPLALKEVQLLMVLMVQEKGL